MPVFGLVSLREATIDYQQFATRFHRLLSFDGFDRHVSVDNMGMKPTYLKLFQNPVANLFFMRVAYSNSLSSLYATTCRQ